MMPQAPTASRRRGSTIRGRLVLLLALAILPIAMVGLVFAVDSQDRQRRNFVDNVRMAADFVADDRERLLVDARRFLVAVATDFDVARAAEPTCGEGLRRTLATSPGFANLGYLDQRGDLVCSAASPTTRVNLGKSTWFRQAMEGAELAISRSVMGLAMTEQIVFLAIPLRTQTKAVGGVLSASVVANALGRRPPPVRHLDGAQVAVLDPTGEPIVAATAPGVDGKEGTAVRWLPPAALIASKLAAHEWLFEYAPADGRDYLYALRPIAAGRAISMLAVPLDARMRSIWLDFAAVAALPLVMWGVAIAAAWFGIDRLIVRPVLRLQRVTAAYASGHFRYRQPELKLAAAEIRDLGIGLNDMADAIQSRTEDLKASVVRNRTLVREIHHRVKNNLQLIASILGTHQRATVSEREQDMLAEIASRVRALGLVHAQFDDPEETMAVELSDLVRALIGRHQLDVALPEEYWNIRLTAADNCWVGVDDAVPCTLLISEILTVEPGPAPDDHRPTLIADVRPGASGRVAVSLTVHCADAHALVDPSASVATRLIDAFLRQLKARVTTAEGHTIEIAMDLAAAVPDGSDA